MKLFFIILSFIVLATALTYVPSNPRGRRDISELKPQNNYLAPGAEFDIPATEKSDIQDSAVVGENGYEYKTVRKLRFRKQRDVSHLKLHYLPPVHIKESQMSPEQLQQPLNDYLPPVREKQSEIAAEQSQPSNEYLPPANKKQLEISPEEPESSHKYFPPAEFKESKEIVTDIPQPSNEYLLPAKLEEEEISEPEPSAKSIENIEPETKAQEITTIAPVDELEIETEMPQDTAVLLDDGYHYRAPSDIPNLFSQSTLPSEEFLTPLDGESVEVDGPSNGDSAVLAKDGYHYRAIKRRF